jgi:GxxExxY protein
MIHEELTERILKTSFEVSNELGSGFLESVYQKALLLALQQGGLKVEAQKQLNVLFRGQHVGEFYADIIVEDVVLIELKATKSLTPEHSAQILNYMKATGIEVGLLVNFGTQKAEIRRFNNRF